MENWFMLKKTKLNQIAEAAGVSISTVDRVINRRGGVSQKREEIVLEWANRLGLDRASISDHNKLIKVAVLLEPVKNPFFKELRSAFDDLAGLIPQVTFSCFFHYIDVENLAETALKIPAIVERFDAIIVLAPDEPKLADSLLQASKSIPVVTMVTDIPHSGRIAYVGPDNRKMGRSAGELIGRFIGEQGGNVLLILGLQRFVGHEEREMGFRSVLRERFKKIDVTACLESSENSIKAGQLVAETLKKDPHLRGIYNVSSGNTEICKVIESLGLEEKITLITHELTPERRALLQDGKIDAILDQNPRLEVQRAFEIVANHLDASLRDTPLTGNTHFNIFLKESC
jgi:LacI family transcriptional regulator